MNITANRDFPGSPVVRPWRFHCCSPGRIHEVWPKIQARKKRNGLTDIENKLAVTGGERDGNRGQTRVGIKRYKLLCIK